MNASTLSDNNEGSSGDEFAAAGPSLPAGVVRPKGRTWAGEEMEMEHSRGDGQKSKTGVVAAVDISQFQNTVVGQGYQARHVIRQRTGVAAPQQSSVTIIDMTRHADNDSESPTVELSTKKRKSDQSPAKDLDPLQKLLRSKAMRDFRRQLEQIR